MRRRDSDRVTGLVLAAGGSRRLGVAKQLLPYGRATLLDHVLGVARKCHLDQLLCVLGGSDEEVRERVDFNGVDVVVNDRFRQGCSSSIAAGMGAVDARSEVVVLMLGDQPGVRAENVEALLDGRGQAALAACAYENGRGHPLAFARSVLPELSALSGDKAVWKLLDGRGAEVVDVPIAGPVPRDVDAWEDYEAVLAAAGLDGASEP